jgi:hypothetical protein
LSMMLPIAIAILAILLLEKKEEISPRRAEMSSGR